MWDFISALFSNAWKFFGLEFPGTGMTFGQIGVGILLLSFFFHLLMNFISFGGDAAPSRDSVNMIANTLRNRRNGGR